MEKGYKNIGYFILLLIPLTLLGFYKSYINKFPEFDDTIDFYDHLHAFVAILWLLLLLSQPLLIRNKQYGWHKILGKLSYFIFPVLILTFIPQFVKIVNSGIYKDLTKATFDVILLNTFYFLAIINKKNVAKHMRYMISLALIFVTPTLGRIIGYWFNGSSIVSGNIPFTLINLTLLGMIIWDIRNKQNYRPYIIALIGFILYQICFNIVYI